MHKLKSKAFSLFFLLFVSAAWGVQNKTYPTAATTQIRWDTYVDDMNTLGHSSWTVELSTWNYLSDGAYWISPSTTFGMVDLWRWDFVNSTYTYIPINLYDYNRKLSEWTRNREIIDGIANNMEIYMVWPDTAPPVDWTGWCLEIINGHDVPVVCP